MKIAIIGLGYWGPNLVKNFYTTEQIQIKYICDLDEKKTKEIISQYPNISVATTNSDRVMQDTEIQAVVIATPVSTHYTLAKQALLAGKHVLIEKPITDNIAEAEELVALAEKHNLILMVDHISVYIGAVQKIKEVIQNGDIGEVLYFTAVRINLGQFQRDVNVVWDLVPHDLSILKYTINEQPVAVSAVGSKHFGELENIAYINILYKTEMIAHCHVNWLSPVKIRSLVIAGNNKMLVYNDLKPHETLKICDKSVHYNNGSIDYKSGETEILKIDTSAALPKVCNAFRESIQKSIAPITDGKYGLDIVRIITAAQTSIHQRGQPIPIQF